MMNEEGSFPRLLELIQLQRRKGEDDPEKAGAGLCRLLMDLLYEMSRIQTVKIEDLGGFIFHFFYFLSFPGKKRETEK